MKTVQQILDFNKERHLKKFAELNNDNQDESESVMKNEGTNFEEGSVLSSVVITLFAFVIFRCVVNNHKKKKTVYVIKSKLWRDEDGQRVAISMSVPISSADQTVPLCDASKNKESCKNHVAGGDLWMLLMSEDVPPTEKKIKRKKKEKNRYNKT